MKHGIVAWRALLCLLVLTGCTRVDETESCIETRYGNVVNQEMSTGLNLTVMTDATCFPLTDQNFPEDQDEPEKIEAQTADPVTVSGDLALVFTYEHDKVYTLFMEKRSQKAALAEIQNAIREGYRNALAGWTVAEIFSARRAALSDSVRAQIQRKVGGRATIKNVYVRDIRIPPEIEEARILAAKQAQVLSQAQQQYTIDSVNAKNTLMQATSSAEATRLRGQAYDVSPRLLDLEIAKEYAKLCGAATTCVLGEGTSALLGLRGGGR